MMESSRTLMETKYYDPLQAFSIVPGSLQYYDFGDLIELLDPDMVKVVSVLPAQRGLIPSDNDNDDILHFLNKK